MRNIAFIDGQNLHLGTAKSTEDPWAIDYSRFRVYLRDKYKIVYAYYLIGFTEEGNEMLYTRLQEAGFILVFKHQMVDMRTNKKGNVDSDLVFHAMRKLIDESEDFDKILLVSGDGDYKILVDYLIEKERFLKILLPNKRFASSLYKRLDIQYRDFVANIRPMIEYEKRGFLKH